jgi:hypothetical protein
MTINRRTAVGVLSGAAALSATAALPGLAAAADEARAAAFDPADQDQLAMAFRKLAYSMDERLTFWWMRGTRYGTVGPVATPFWDMYIGAWFTTRDLPDGRYEVRQVNANYYTAPGGTELLERFANPFTGRTVDVPYNRPRATTSIYDRKGGSPFAGAAAPPGMKSTRQTDVGPAWIVGDMVHVQGDLMLRNEPLEPGRRGFTVNDWSTYVGALADVADPAQRNPPAAQMFVDILDFPPWLQMGEQPGAFVSRCYGRKVFDYASMPATWRALLERKFPDVARDPGAVLRA